MYCVAIFQQGCPVPGGAVPHGRGERDGLPERRKGYPMLKFLIMLQNLVAEPVRRDDSGATAVEYGLIVTLIAVAIIGVVTLVGVALAGKFQQVLNSL
jgi:pilus assembly protein Flp/PilA